MDFRLNAVTKKDAFLLPLMSDCIESLAGNRYMSTLDMASGYWQTEIYPDDREYTNFITRFWLFEHEQMNTGLCSPSSTFQRAMNMVMSGLSWKIVLPSLDDVLLLGKDFENHIRNLREILDRFREYKLKRKPKKCILFQDFFFFFLGGGGEIVTGDSVSVDPESIEAGKAWPEPTNTTDVEFPGI